MAASAPAVSVSACTELIDPSMATEATMLAMADFRQNLIPLFICC